jgi:CheY-like chemotaxis protein
MIESFHGKPIEILLVEDNPGDVCLTRQAFESGRVLNNLSVVNDGRQAMAFLRHENEYVDAPRPDLILLDLNLPAMDGREVLHEIKKDAVLRRIPVIILTTSQAEKDIKTTYESHANSFITKPVDLDEFLNIIKEIETFWLNVVKLPQDRLDYY